MTKKTMTLFVFVTLAAMNSFANAVAPVLSVECSAPGKPVSEFSFDLYATGHPMGGVTMFTGMFAAKSDGELQCSEGHIVTMTPVDGKLDFEARINCAVQQEIELLTTTNLFTKGVSYSATLSYRTLGALGDSSPWTSQQMECVQQ